MASGSKVWSAYGLGATVVATVVARKTISTGWRIATGRKPPNDASNPDVSIGEAIAFAAASGAAVGLARMLANRQAASYYRKSTGHLPPNLEDVDA